jgi:hypothetical protein
VACETRVTFAGRGMPTPNSNGRLNIACADDRDKMALT